MACVDLPCDYEQWAEYKNLFIMLSHLRSIDDLKLFIGSYTRSDTPPSVTASCLKALQGLVVFLTDNFCCNEQKKFMKKTFPFIAKSAGLLEARVPISGLPFLEKQENSALVLGRKVVLSLICNAFLCTFPCDFSFESFFNVFLEDDEEEKKLQAAKLNCIMCYFESAAEGLCNLSGVITFRRLVLRKQDLPVLNDWVANPSPLCPFTVDHKLLVEDSGGQTLQVCFASKTLGGDVLRSGCSIEEVRFCIFPEALVVMLIMEAMDSNEAVIVTGTERFARHSGSGSKFEFLGQYKDETEHDVFGNMLNSFVSLNASPPVSSQGSLQYLPASLLQELIKAYVGFFCQEDRGDISTEKLALSVKRGSLAFAEELYPACIPQLNFGSSLLRGAQSKPSQSSNHVTDVDDATPLSPILEMCEPTLGGFQSELASNILRLGMEQAAGEKSVPERKVEKSPEQVGEEVEGGEAKGRIEEFSAQIARSLLLEVKSSSFPTHFCKSVGGEVSQASSTADCLASHLASTIVQLATLESGDWNKSLSPSDNEEERLENTSDAFAKSIINEVLQQKTIVSPPSQVRSVLPEMAVEPSNFSTGSEQVKITDADVMAPSSSFASRLISSALSEGIQTAVSQLDTRVVQDSSTIHPPIIIQAERCSSGESGRRSQSSSLTGQNITVLDYTEEVAGEVIRDGLSIAKCIIQGKLGQQEAEASRAKMNGDSFSKDLATEAIQEMVVNDVSPQHGAIREEAQKPREIDPTLPLSSSSDRAPPNFPKQLFPKLGCHAVPNSTVSYPPDKMQQQQPHHSLAINEQGFPVSASNPVGVTTPAGNSMMNPRLLTPLSSRGYAWSTASTQDEESRPVTPIDLDKIGLSLSNNTEEFTSLFSKMVINHAIGNVTGGIEGRLSPRTISSESNDLTSLTSSSKVGIYLSQLAEAEPPCDGGMAEMTTSNDDTVASSNSAGGNYSASSTLWDLTKQLLRPIATGNWVCGSSGDGDPQLTAMIQWMATTACSRPYLLYYTTNDDRVKQLSQVTAHLRNKGFSVGKLCQALLVFQSRSEESDRKQDVDLFTFLLQI